MISLLKSQVDDYHVKLENIKSQPKEETDAGDKDEELAKAKLRIDELELKVIELEGQVVASNSIDTDAIEEEDSEDVLPLTPSVPSVSPNYGLARKVRDLEREAKRLTRERDQLEEDYRKLEEKWKPFQDQLDGLADINDLLQTHTKLAQSEIEKISAMYAKLMGHQNQKQKIQHVKKLKEENMTLKQVDDCSPFLSYFLIHYHNIRR
jgi:hyaluronan-mediated motility receptor